MAKVPPKVCVRNPTDDEIETIRCLIKKAGGEPELHRWIRLACPRRKGRPPGSTKFADYDDEVLAIAEPLCALSRGKLSFNAVLKAIIADANGPLHGTIDRGASQHEIVKRLHRKSLAERRAFNQLKKSEIVQQFIEFRDWLSSPGDEDVKSMIAGLYLAVSKARDHSE